MSARSRVIAFATVTVVVIVVATTFAWQAKRQHDETFATAPTERTTSVAALADAPRIVFRHTGLDDRNGRVAMVALADPGGPRAFTDVLCDRVAAVPTGASCLVTEPGVVTRFAARMYDEGWRPQEGFALPGIPSRTRLSADGRMVGVTSFVTGHSYMTSGFSTATSIHRVAADGTLTEVAGNLEDLTLVLDGERVRPTDRNIWGVTFLDDRTFLATVATGGRTWLVHGDLDTRTLTGLQRDAECPSLSPDGSRVAFKVDVAPGASKLWQVAVLELSRDGTDAMPGPGTRTMLSEGTRGLDDQVAWLDDDTLMYAVPREDAPGVSDVWSVDTDPAAEPAVLIRQAASPTVVR